MTRIAKKQENTTHNEEPSHSIKTNPELARMLEIDDDMKTLIITKKLCRDMEQPEKEQRGITLLDFKTQLQCGKR